MEPIYFGLHLLRRYQKEILTRPGAVATVVDVIIVDRDSDREVRNIVETGSTDFYYVPIFRFVTRTGEEVRARYTRALRVRSSTGLGIDLIPCIILRIQGMMSGSNHSGMARITT